MKPLLALLTLLFLVSCSSAPAKNSGKVSANNSPKCSWDKPFTPCEPDVKPMWTACPEGYRDLANGMPNVGIHCVPESTQPSSIRTINQ